MRAVNRQIMLLAVAGIGLLGGAGIAVQRAQHESKHEGREGQEGQDGQDGQEGYDERYGSHGRPRYTAATRDGVASTQTMRNGHLPQYWPDGRLKFDATYRDDAYDGEYRSFYASGSPYELRHYVNGHEEGVQQSWTEEGVLYLNYEVRGGRRFGLVNASPCNTVGAASRAFTASNETGTRPQESRAQPKASPNHAAKLDARTRVAAISAIATPRGTNGAGLDPAAAPAGGPALPYYNEPTFRPNWSPVEHRVATFTLKTQTGATISDSDLRGKPYVASFIYTQCAAVCPILVRQLTRVQSALGQHGARIVSFSVTPDTDTPAALAQFGTERNIDSRAWSLVTGSKRAIYTLARESYFADDSRVGASPDDVTAFLHTEKLVLVDGEGRLRGIYNGTQPHAVDQLIVDLSRLTSSH